MFNCEPDDPKIEDMDPIKKLWMFNNWIADQNDEVELAKNHAYLLGSFWNPEAVRKMRGQDGTTYKSTEEDFDKSTEIVERQIKIEKEQSNKKRKRKKIK